MSSSGIRAGRAFVEVGMKDKLTGGLNKLQKRFKNFGAGMARVGLKIAGLGAAIGAPLLLAVSKFANVGDELNKLSARTRISVESLSQLSFAAEQSGTNLKSLGNAIFRMSRRIGNARTETGPAAKALRELGLEAKALSELNPAEQFFQVADALKKIPNESRRAQLGFEVLGDNFRDLVPLMADGSAGIKDLMKQFDDLGGTMSTKSAQAAADYADAMNKVKIQLKAVWLQIGGSLAPILTTLSGKIQPVVKRIIDWVAANRPLIATIFKVAAGVTAAGIAIVGMGGALIAVGAAMSGAIAISGAMSAAFTLVGVTASAAWAAMLSPIGILTIGIAGLGAVVLTQTDVMQKALGFLGTKFSELADRALKSFTGIKDAITGGEIELAWKILTLSLGNEWAKASIGIQEKTLGMRDAFIDTFVDIEIAWAEMIGALQDSWSVFNNFFADSFAKTVGGIAHAILLFKGALDSSFDFKAAQQANVETIAFGISERRKSLVSGVGQREQERGVRIKEIESEGEKRKAANREALEASMQSLAAARLELSALIAKAAERPAAIATKPGETGGGGIETGAIAKALTESVSRVLEPISAKSKEGFDRILRATQGLGGVSPEKETADNTKKTNEILVQHGQKLEKLCKCVLKSGVGEATIS